MKKRINYVLLFVITLTTINFTVSAQSTDRDDIKQKETVSKTNAGKVIVLNKADFTKHIYNYEKNPEKWIYENNKPCIIDFYATWCGPCQRVSPILAELANTYKGQILIYKIDVDQEKELATSFGIQSIPTLLFVPTKGTPRISQGALSKEDFIDQIETFLLNKKKPQ